MPDPGTTRSLQVFAAVVGYFAVCLGAVVLVGGWGLDITSLKSVLPGLSTMKANTALGIAALGTSLALADNGPRLRVVGMAAGALALILGLLTLAEYALDWNLGMDQLLFTDAATPVAAHPGRPAIATAITIALLGAAQICRQIPVLHGFKTAAAVAASLIPWAALSGYVFGPQALHQVPLFSSMAVHTVVALLVLSISTLAAQPISWPISTAFAKGTGGTVCRWLLPPAILAPPFFGWILDRESVFSGYPDPFRWALYAATSSLGSVWLILLLAHRITVIDTERSAATELSLHDPLTGLANRRAFDSFLLESFKLAKRHNHPLSLVLLDIDRFKSYNDHYGHPAGDQLLNAIGTLLSSLARETDLVARVGGEEFCIALPETDLAGARVIAERVRAEVERSRLFKCGVTVSVGVAAVSDSTATPSMLIEDCDAALYRAKAAGRNHVSMAGELACTRSA